jgi:Collagen triple helix repeat (20 copies)
LQGFGMTDNKNEALRGERGHQGARGDQGDQGDRGVQGDRGLRGERGYSQDHDILIGLERDIGYLRQRFDDIMPIVARLDREAVLRPTLTRLIGVFSTLMAATAATFGLYVHR